MEGIFIIGKSKDLKSLSDNFVELPNPQEIKIHDWVISKLANSDFDKVVIELDENLILSLQIGYHIRLSLQELNRKSLIPILFISSLPLNTIVNTGEIYSHILSSRGTYFSEFEDIETLKKEVGLIEGLTEREYSTKFLKTIKILPDETTGRHSLANVWGAYAMDKAANTNALPADAEFKKELYFKYISAFNNLYKLKASSPNIVGKIAVGDPNFIQSERKRILLIDDEADNGWETVLRKVFKTTNDNDFVVIKEKVKDYEAFSDTSKKIIENNTFDLYLIDLRLNGLEEEDNLNTKEFSGMKVLNKIKSINEGNQVIIFTASNKVWNLKALLDAGADGYYMKESPEYNFTRNFSEQNYEKFKEDVHRCFERCYLRDIFKKTEILKKGKLSFKSADTLKFNDLNNLKLTIIQNLDSAFSLAQNNTTIEYALFNYLQILESYCNFFTYSDEKKAIVYKCYSDKKKRKNEIVVFEKVDKVINSRYKYVKDYYPFQKKKTDEKDKQFVNYLHEKTNYKDDELKFSFALKLAAVLNEQLGSLSELPKLMEIIYIRNNKIAHLGQNFDDSKRKILKEDVKTVFNTINNLLINKSFL